MNFLIDVSGKLPSGLVEMYQLVEAAALEQNIRFLIVGALSRDLIMHHGYGAAIERGTRDVDFAIQIARWDEFDTLKLSLIKLGFNEDSKLQYRLHYRDKEDIPWELDLLPFGDVSDDAQDISWPPEGDFKMSTFGFPEALENSWSVKIKADPDSGCIVPVASPVAVILLKLVAWTERESGLRAKDALDVAYIIKSYEKIPATYSRLFDEGFMESSDWDSELASAKLLGEELVAIASSATKEYLQKNLIKSQQQRNSFIADMQTDSAADWLDALLQGI